MFVRRGQDRFDMQWMFCDVYAQVLQNLSSKWTAKVAKVAGQIVFPRKLVYHMICNIMSSSVTRHHLLSKRAFNFVYAIPFRNRWHAIASPATQYGVNIIISMRACNGSLSHAARHGRGVHRLAAPGCGEQFAAFCIVDKVAHASEPADWLIICL